MMALMKLLGWRGLAGIGVALAVLTLWLIQKGETRHWKKQSAQFEQLYHGEQSAHAATVANYRAAAEQARQADQANAARAATEQRQINERTAHDFETRLAVARARADQLQHAAQTSTHSGGGEAAPVSGVPAGAAGADEAAGQGRFSATDALTATEQAIQLDELIKWIERQHAVDPNGKQEKPDGR